MRAVRRLSSVVITGLLGWAAELGVYLAIANPSAHDLRFWAAATGIYWLGALLLVGVPIAFMDPAAYLGRRRWKAVGLVGLIGVLLALIPPSGAMFLITGPLGFVGGVFAMLAYTSFVSLFPDFFGAPDEES